MDAPVTPAEGSGVQNAEVTAQETPTTAAVNTPAAEPASGAATQPSVSQPTKPDLATLLSDAELRQAILKDPELRREFFRHPDPETQAEMEHRVASEAGRRARAELDRIQRQQDLERQQADLERLESMDEYDAGVEAKKQAATKRQELAQQAQALAQQAEQEDIHKRLQPLLVANIGQLGQRAHAKLSQLAQQAGLTDLTFLAPHLYEDYEDWLAETHAVIAKAMGEKEFKTRLPLEKQAWLEEHSASTRAQAGTPVVLPAGETSMSNDDFMAAYAAGKTNDHKRAMQILGR